jgi:transposase
MFDVMNLSKDVIIETILADNTFILLEELTKWSNKNVYINAINNAFERMSSKEVTVIEGILKNDFEYLDKNFKKEKSVIIDFLSFMYPTESFKKKSDVSILEYMTELSELYKKYYK